MPSRERREAPVRITTAAPNVADDISARQRRYVLSMLLRTACFLGAVLVGPGWFRWVLIAGAVFLPYVAVVMANAMPSRSNSALPTTGRPGHELSSGRLD